jgi:hypothetical protein
MNPDGIGKFGLHITTLDATPLRNSYFPTISSTIIAPREILRWKLDTSATCYRLLSS